MNNNYNKLKKLNILLVDDEKTALELTKKILLQYFNKIFIANNAEKAYNILKNENIDLVISDINMPDIDGFEFVKTIKEKYPNIKVFFLSADFDFDTLIKAIDLNVDGFLTKPFNYQNLLNKANNVLSTKAELNKNINLLNQYKDIVDENLLVSKTDINGIITYANNSFINISGFTKEELINKPHNIVRHPDMKKEVFKELWETILNKKTWKGLIKNRKKNGDTYYVETVIKPILDSNGEIEEFIALRKDITNFISAEEIINDKLKQINSNVLLIMIKIQNFDGMKLIYDTETLKKIQRRILLRIRNILKKKFKKIDSFIINEGLLGYLIEDFEKGNIKKIIHNIPESLLNNPLIIDNFEYYPIVKISYAYGNKHLYKNTFIGLKELEKTNENIIFANDLCKKNKEIIQKNMNILKNIQYAIKNNKIISLYQPIIDNETKKTIKYESLIRIKDENDNLLTPYHFLDIAKKAGVYNNLTLKILENSFKFHKKSKLPISINISPSDILVKSIREKIYYCLEEIDSKNMITFELLEDEIMDIDNTIKKFIKKIISLNANIAIDDFGSGYSNFIRVSEINAEIIKIDGFLIKDIHLNKTKQNIVESIVIFAKKENKKTVAEFVENKEIFEIVKNLGVDYSQGYYFSKPLFENEII